MSDPARSPANPGLRRRFRPARVLVPLVIAVAVLSILAERVPELHDARERLLHPIDHPPRKACETAALAAAERPQYARIRARGRVHATPAAHYVEGVEVGEMGPAGAEVAYGFSCYVAPDGTVIEARKDPAAPPGG